MADVKISALPAATTPLAGTEVLPIVQGGTTDQVTVANLTAGRTVAAATLNVDANSATAAVRITQTGAGNALVVEDSANPDATPFVVDTIGRVLVGSSSIVNTAVLGAAFLQVNGDGNERSQLAISRFSADSDKPRLSFLKSRGASVGTNSIVSNGDVLGELNFLGADGSGATGYPIGASIYANVDGTPGANDMPGRLVFSTTADGASAPTERLRISNNGFTRIINGAFSRGAPVTKTGDFTLADTENWVICNGTGTITVTFPAAASWTGREVMVKTIAAFTVVSASSNIVPLIGGVAGTAILAATAGKWATLVSDGTNWVIMAAVV
jgi:hypothetical protein